MNEDRALLPGEAEVRMVLLGRCGVGKSSSGNTILNQTKPFTLNPDPSVSQKCQKETETIGDLKVTVVDTPGMFDPEKTEDAFEEIKESVKICHPGPHVFLILLKVKDKITDELQQMVEIICRTFGKNTMSYAMILFTYGSRLQGKTIEQHIHSDPALRDLVIQCHWKYHVMDNNKKTEIPGQVPELLQKIKSTLERNNGSFYDSDMFKRAEIAFKEQEAARLQHQADVKPSAEVNKAKLAVLKTIILCGTAVGLVAGYFAGGGQVTTSIGAAVGGSLGALLGAATLYSVIQVKKYIEKRKAK